MEEKKIFILVQRLFFCLMCCLTCFEANSFRRNINCIFCTVTDVSMAVVLWKYYGSESSDRLERKGLYIQQRRMVECLNKRVQFRSGWYKYSEGFFFFFLWMKKCWKHGSLFSLPYFFFLWLHPGPPFFPFLPGHVSKSGYWYNNNTDAQSFNPIT